MNIQKRSFYIKRMPHFLLNKVITLCGLIGLLSFTSPVMADESLEYGVKAAFLYKFGSYVEWPATAFPTPSSPLNVCVMGGVEQFTSTLEKAVSAESINGHNVVVRPVKSVGKESGCHILYIDPSENNHSPEITESLRGSNVLTVSNNGAPGIIDFVIANNRVRFNIDDEAAAQNGLTISSKLLSVALKVKRRTSKGT